MKNNEKKEALLYYATKENVNKLIQAVKLKPGKEKDIKISFGSGKYLETKKALITLGIIDDSMNLTNVGREIAYDNSNAKSLWFETIMKYKPYESYLSSYIINHKAESEDIATTDIQNFWGRNDFGNSEQNRKDAAPTFAGFLELAGIAEFTIGRRGNTSRIVIDSTKLIENSKKLDSSNSNIQEEVMQETNAEENETINLQNPLNTVRTVDNPITTNTNDNSNHNNFSNATININIDMSTWSEESVVKALEIIKEI